MTFVQFIAEQRVYVVRKLGADRSICESICGSLRLPGFLLSIHCEGFGTGSLETQLECVEDRSGEAVCDKMN